MKALALIIIVATTGVSAFLHNNRQLRLLHAASLTKQPMLGEVAPHLSGYPKDASTRQMLTTTVRSTSVQLFMTPLDGIVHIYSYASSNYYLATQAATMSLFSGVGDFLAQTLERRTSLNRMMKLNSSNKSNMLSTASTIPHDWKRTRRFLMKGIGCGLIWTAWYQIAELWSHGLTNAVLSSYQMTLTKQSLHRLESVVYTVVSILLEQFVASPIIFGLWDIPLLSYLHGTPVTKLPGVVRKKLFPLLIANAKLWTLVNILIYNVPLEFRVAALSCADLVWQMILSTNLASPEATTSNDDDGGDGGHSSNSCIELGDEESALPLVA